MLFQLFINNDLFELQKQHFGNIWLLSQFLVFQIQKMDYLVLSIQALTTFKELDSSYLPVTENSTGKNNLSIPKWKPTKIKTTFKNLLYPKNWLIIAKTRVTVPKRRDEGMDGWQRWPEVPTSLTRDVNSLSHPATPGGGCVRDQIRVRVWPHQKPRQATWVTARARVECHVWQLNGSCHKWHNARTPTLQGITVPPSNFPKRLTELCGPCVCCHFTFS